MNCKWKSKDNTSCNRHIKDGHTCVFHKNNKNKRENILFNYYIKKDKIDRRNNYLYLSSKAVETINKINLYQLRLYNILIKKFDLEKVSSTIEVLKQLDEIMANSELE